MNDFMEKEKIEALKIHLAEYLNTVWKTFAALMIAIGWVLSSKEAKEVINQFILIRVVLVIVLVVMAIAHFLTIFNLHKKSMSLKKSFDNDSTKEYIELINTYNIPLVDFPPKQRQVVKPQISSPPVPV